jgi:hypothetical protein
MGEAPWFGWLPGVCIVRNQGAEQRDKEGTKYRQTRLCLNASEMPGAANCFKVNMALHTIHVKKHAIGRVEKHAVDATLGRMSQAGQ